MIEQLIDLDFSLTVRWKRIILSFVIMGAQVEAVNTRACVAPASAASLQSSMVSRVD